jgi:ABC-2 type transport system permease protein
LQEDKGIFMEFKHIWAVVLRHARLWMKDPNLIIVTLYWPLLDVLIWGFLGSWIQQIQQTSYQYQMITLFSILIWQSCCRSSVVLVSGFLEELWSMNIVNLFSLPLRFTEWIGGITLFTFLLNMINAIYCMTLIFAFYQIPILTILKVFILFAPPLFISGLWLGFMALQLIAQFGKRAQELSWVLSWFFSPLCGVFYPINIFPLWLQKISYFLPMTHVFEGLRAYLMHGTNPTTYLVYAYSLSILYALIAMSIFVFIFNRSKRRGLARLAD